MTRSDALKSQSSPADSPATQAISCKLDRQDVKLLTQFRKRLSNDPDERYDLQGGCNEVAHLCEQVRPTLVSTLCMTVFNELAILRLLSRVSASAVRRTSSLTAVGRNGANVSASKSIVYGS